MIPTPRSRPAGDNAASTSQEVAPRFRSAAVRRTLIICAGLIVAVFIGLGTWQLKRLQWKLDLIARVSERVHAPAIAAPTRERWSQVTADADEYRHVRVAGTFLYPLTVRVQAVTELGSGFWLLTPLRTADGSVVLINRGFVPAKAGDWRPQVSPDTQNISTPTDIAVVSGLLRMTEPGGAFLRHNDPIGNRWYSRDVQAIAAARNLPLVAPYFVDADATKQAASTETAADSAKDQPVGGLTVIAFHNNHLVYALTWYALALMLGGAGFWILREERRIQNDKPGDDRKTNSNTA
ncbi:SURF1 family protein [Glaciimonas sp. PCH181]|uniref:SURF1 family protein n=1 Tax=Glaciimonas sp. PCH181 TaxID=2133943 RepID=UPI000D38FD8E|nr:SURF1 family protein [Glaciimonas sp. PCH181]PUA17541.1 hypothetical protein C7W93_16765 [Glaciimonas sp. PCH181]